MIPYFRSVLGAYERELPDAPGHRAPGAQAVHLEGDCQAQAQVFHPVSEGPGAQVNNQVSNLHFFCYLLILLSRAARVGVKRLRLLYFSRSQSHYLRAVSALEPYFKIFLTKCE